MPLWQRESHRKAADCAGETQVWSHVGPLGPLVWRGASQPTAPQPEAEKGRGAVQSPLAKTAAKAGESPWLSGGGEGGESGEHSTEACRRAVSPGLCVLGGDERAPSDTPEVQSVTEWRSVTVM